MGKFYLKTAIAAVVALFALGGDNRVSAQTTTLYERALTGDNAWTAKGISDWTAGASNTTVTTSTTADKGFLITVPADRKNASHYDFSTPIKVSASNSTLDLTASITTGGAYSSYWSIKLGDVEFSYSDNNGAYVQIGDSKTNLKTNQRNDLRGKVVNLTFSINQATKAVSYTVDWASSKDESGTGSTSVTDFSSIIIEKSSGIWGYETSGGLQAIKLTETASTATYANYTVNFVDASGNTLKSETRTGEIGESISANDDDKSTWYSEDKTKKYIFDSESATGVVNAENSAALTVKYNEYDQYTAKLTFKYGDNSDEKVVTNYTDEPSVTIYYPAYIKDEAGVYYGIKSNEEAPSFGAILTKDNTEKTITYTKDEDVVYFAEYEDLGGKYFNANFNPELSSNGTSKFLSSSTASTKIGLTSDGNYEVTVRGGNRDSGHNTNLKVYLVSDTENPIYTSSTIKASSVPAEYSFKTSLKAGDELYFTSGSGNDRFAGDYVLVKKVPSPTVALNSASHLASYSNSSAVTVPADVDIYIATTVNESTITLEKLAGKVIPANTGVILYSATPGEKTLTFGGETTDDVTNNILKATADGTFTATASTYALKAGEQSFAKVAENVVIPANKAYFTTTSTQAKFNVIFDGTTTGINNIETAAAENNDAPAYNIAGQRVSKSYKGVVIKNGKKLMQK